MKICIQKSYIWCLCSFITVVLVELKCCILSVAGTDLSRVLLPRRHGEVTRPEASRDDGPRASQNSRSTDRIPGPHSSPSVQVSPSVYLMN